MYPPLLKNSMVVSTLLHIVVVRPGIYPEFVGFFHTSDCSWRMMLAFVFVAVVVSGSLYAPRFGFCRFEPFASDNLMKMYRSVLFFVCLGFLVSDRSLHLSCNGNMQ